MESVHIRGQLTWNDNTGNQNRTENEKVTFQFKSPDCVKWDPVALARTLTDALRLHTTTHKQTTPLCNVNIQVS